MHGRRWASVALALLLASSLAGCVNNTDGGDGPDGGNGGDGKTPAAKGSVSGVIVDDRGNPLAGVKVDINRVFLSVETGADGAFAFSDLAPNTYRLTLTKEHYRRVSESVDVAAGASVVKAMEMLPIMLAPGVPAAHGKMVDYAYVPLDVLLYSAGPPGARITNTNETKENTFPGFWSLEPEAGYLLAYLTVTVIQYPMPPIPPPLPPPVPPFPPLPDLPALPEQEIAMHYFRGEGPLENELVENMGLGIHEPEPYMNGTGWKIYHVENNDLEEWGERTWQVGVYAIGPNVTPAGGGIIHALLIRGILVEASYALS